MSEVRPHHPVDLRGAGPLLACLAARGLPPDPEHVDTMPVTQGVTCDVYRLRGTGAYDLAIVEVQAGHRTPLQRVLSGTETVEGHVTGRGTLLVRSAHGAESTYRFPGERAAPVVVRVGDVMRWCADDGEELVFFELCAPPYTDGRFADLDENAGDAA